jgi:hypothetical protein
MALDGVTPTTTTVLTMSVEEAAAMLGVGRDAG